MPVSDVDRAKDFYVDKVGFKADHDQRVDDNLRFVQLTPPGSACSIALGDGLSESEPGSVKGLQVVVADIEETRQALEGRGLDVGEIVDLEWGRFLYFADPDGNAWSIQQLPQRP